MASLYMLLCVLGSLIVWPGSPGAPILREGKNRDLHSLCSLVRATRLLTVGGYR